MDPVLRPSLFTRVPPFINYVPSPIPEISSTNNAAGGGVIRPTRGPQYWDQQKWDQDQFWRIPISLGNWLAQWAQMLSSSRMPSMGKIPDTSTSRVVTRNGATTIVRRTKKGRSKSVVSSLIIDPFEEKAADSIAFMEFHPGVKLVMFPKLHQIARKDNLGRFMNIMRKKFPDEFSFHPETFVLPEERKQLSAEMAKGSKNDLWIVKPPNNNNGTGVRVITGHPSHLPQEGNESLCVQRYIKSPFLVYGFKFDIRVYVLLTSLDPVIAYVYEDGLVRIATEKYSEHPSSARDPCVHVTNFAVNKKLNAAKFVFSDNVSENVGNKWRLRRLWTYFHEVGIGQYDLELIWSRIEDVVIKSLLCAHTQMRADYRKITEHSNYNCYKLLGYDLMLDRDLNVHLVEINARPQLLDDELDKTVNRPMVSEMLRIIGYHIPSNLYMHKDIGAKLVDNSGSKAKKSGIQFVTFERKVYSRHPDNQDEVKQSEFSRNYIERKEYVKEILRDLTSLDVRTLIRLEEERSQLKQFRRIFPTPQTHAYFRFMESVSYFDKLLDAYETEYGMEGRERALNMINSHCQRNVHL